MRNKHMFFVGCIDMHYTLHLYGIGNQYYQIFLYFENDV